jgi:nucleotide-binding universal stress UspA family protein
MKETNPKTNHILVPVDFSPHSEAALLLACSLAKCFDAAPLVLHVVHDPAEMPGYYQKAMKKKYIHRIEDSARDMLADFLAHLAKRHREVKGIAKFETILVRGLPSTRILEVAKKRDVSMIVMGSKGRTGIKHLLVGSVAEHVVQFSPVPVTVTKLNP